MSFIKIADYKFEPLVWIIIVGLFFLRIGTSMSIPFLSIYLHFKVGISLPITGIVVGLSYLSQIFGGFFGGVLSDRYGRRRVLALSLFLYALTFFVFGLAGSLTDPLIVMITFGILNLVAGLFRVWSETIAQAMLSDIATPNQKLNVFSIRYTAVNFGSAIGPILGSLIGLSGTMSGFYFTGIMCLAYFMLFTLSSKQVRKHFDIKQSELITLSQTATTLFRDKLLLYYILGGIFSYSVYVQLESTFGQIIMQRFGNSDVYTMILVTNAITVICLQIPLTKYFLRKYKPLDLMKVGCFFIAGGVLGTAFAGLNYAYYIISQIIFTLGEICIFSIGGVFIDEIAPANLRGAYFGSLGFQYLGKTLGSIIGGILLQMLDGTITLCIFAVIAVGTMGFYIKSSKYVLPKSESSVNIQCHLCQDKDC